MFIQVMPDGTRLQLTSGITPIANGSQLRLDSVMRSDEGEYICEGQNGLERVDQSAYIAAYGKSKDKLYYGNHIMV